MLTGTVAIDGLLRNVVVCADLNNNGSCEAAEPTSAATGATGSYRIEVDTTKVSADDIAATSLIAQVVPGVIDLSDNGAATETRSYALRQVKGKAGQINPLTTLVSAGMAAGMTEAVARANVANQLGIAQAKIDNYQDDPATDNDVVRDNARLMAAVVATTLEDGATLSVADPSVAAPAAPNDLTNLRYTDLDNFSYRYFDTAARASGDLSVTLKDVRAGKDGGVPNTQLYTQAYLKAGAWIVCDANMPFTSAGGTPSRSSFCGNSLSVGRTLGVDIGGRRMADVVTELQADTGRNVINNGLATTKLLQTLGFASFPAGSRINYRRTLSLNQPVFINSRFTDGFPTATATTLEGVIAARPASGVNLATSGGSLSLGISTGNLRNLRVAFSGTHTNPATTGAVQFFECDLNEAQTVASNCAATQSGTYTVSTENGVRMMRFAGHNPTVMNHTRLLVEVRNTATLAASDQVFTARENKKNFSFATSEQARLNATAWDAMRKQLGL